MDQYTDIASLNQRWASYWQNQQKWGAERAAGQAAAAGDWEGAKKEALSRGELPLYSDLSTLHRNSQAEFGQKLLGAALATKNPKDWNAVLDLLSQHGVGGVSRYRIPAGGDFEAMKNAALIELGQYNAYLKTLREEQEAKKATFIGTATRPAVSREIPTPLIPEMGTTLQSRPTAPAGASVAYPSERVGDAAYAAEAAPMSFGDVMTRLNQEMAGRGIPTPTTRIEEPEKNYTVAMTPQGEPILHELPPGMDFDGKGTKAKRAIELEMFDSIKRSKIEDGTYTNDDDVRREVADFLQRSRTRKSSDMQMMEYGAQDPEHAARVKEYMSSKRGKSGASWRMEAADRVIAEARAAGRPEPTFQEALEIVQGAGKQDPASIQKLNMIMGPNGAQVLDAMKKQAEASGQLKEPEAIRMAQRFFDDAQTAGHPITMQEAYNIAKGSGRESSFGEKVQFVLERFGPNISQEELFSRVAELEKGLTGEERILRKIGAEAGTDTAGAIERKAAAKSKGEGVKKTWQERSADRIIEEARNNNQPVPSYHEALKMARSVEKQEPAAVQKLKMIMGPDGDKVIAAMKREAEATGQLKDPEAIRMARLFQEEARQAGKPITTKQAYDMAKEAGAKDSTFEEKRQAFKEAYPEASDKEILDLVHDFDQRTSSDGQLFDRFKEMFPGEDDYKTLERVKSFKEKLTAEERLRADVKKETGASTLEAEQKIASARQAGRSTPVIMSARGKDASGREVDGTMFINPVTQEQKFVPNPEGVTDVAKYAARNNKMNAELEEIDRIRKEKGVDTLTALRLRTENTKLPSAELQGINILKQQFPDESFDELVKHWTELNTRTTEKDRKIAQIMRDHPGETREDAEMRAAAANQLTKLKYNTEKGAWEATPIEGSIADRRLDEKRLSDVQALAKSYANDPRFAGYTEAERMAMAKSALLQRGYNVHLDEQGNAVYTVAQNSRAALEKQRTDTYQMLADTRKRVMTDPVLRSQMSWAMEAAKFNVKQEGREAQTIVVDNHINGVLRLAGGANLERPDDPVKRANMEKALGYFTTKTGMNVWRGVAQPGNDISPTAYSLLQYKRALMAESARLLSMGMTSNIAHEHAKELSQVVGDLEAVPSVKSLVTAMGTLKEITGAIRTLPLIPMDPIEAQKGIAHRLEQAGAATHDKASAMAKEITEFGPPRQVKLSDGKMYWVTKSLSADGSKVIFNKLGEVGAEQ